MFQFYLSSIKRKEQADARKAVVEFQFYLSSIKRKEQADARKAVVEFQFYLSSIKSLLIKNINIK